LQRNHLNLTMGCSSSHNDDEVEEVAEVEVVKEKPKKKLRPKKSAKKKISSKKSSVKKKGSGDRYALGDRTVTAYLGKDEGTKKEGVKKKKSSARKVEEASSTFEDTEVALKNVLDKYKG